MVFVLTCQKCGFQVKSPEGRVPAEYGQFLQLIIDMGLACRVCDGEVAGSAEGQ